MLVCRPSTHQPSDGINRISLSYPKGGALLVLEDPMASVGTTALHFPIPTRWLRIHGRETFGERWNSLGIFLRFHRFPVGLEAFKCIFKTLIIVVIGARQDSDYLERVDTRCLIRAYHNQTSVPTPQCFSPELELYDSTRMEQPTNQPTNRGSQQNKQCDGEKSLTT